MVIYFRDLSVKDSSDPNTLTALAFLSCKNEIVHKIRIIAIIIRVTHKPDMLLVSYKNPINEKTVAASKRPQSMFKNCEMKSCKFVISFAFGSMFKPCS